MNPLLEVHLNEPVVGRDIEMNPLLEVYLNEPDRKLPTKGSFKQASNNGFI